MNALRTLPALVIALCAALAAAPAAAQPKKDMAVLAMTLEPTEIGRAHV